MAQLHGPLLPQPVWLHAIHQAVQSLQHLAHTAAPRCCPAPLAQVLRMLLQRQQLR